MENSKRSIFKQKVYAKRYEVRLIKYYTYSNCGYNLEYRIAESTSDLIEEKEIFTCDLEMPLLEVGDKFYIEELKLLVTIKERYRTSKENVVYFIDNKFIEDEQTTASKQDAENLFIQRKENKSKLQELNEIIKEKDEIIKKYNYSFLGNFIK